MYTTRKLLLIISVPEGYDEEAETALWNAVDGDNGVTLDAVSYIEDTAEEGAV